MKGYKIETRLSDGSFAWINKDVTGITDNAEEAHIFVFGEDGFPKEKDQKKIEKVNNAIATHTSNNGAEGFLNYMRYIPVEIPEKDGWKTEDVIFLVITIIGIGLVLGFTYFFR